MTRDRGPFDAAIRGTARIVDEHLWFAGVAPPAAPDLTLIGETSPSLFAVQSGTTIHHAGCPATVPCECGSKL